MSKYGHRTHNWFESIVNKLGGEEGAEALLRGELVVVEKVTAATPPKKKGRNKKVDTIIVDRSVAPTYPSWVGDIMHPDLEKTGPEKFDVCSLDLWIHEEQEGGKWIEGHKLYEHLKSNNMLESCLGLRDLEEIQKRGIDFFRQHFKGKAIFGWKSVVRNSDGHLRVPFLCEDGGVVALRWYWLGRRWHGGGPALRFAK